MMRTMLGVGFGLGLVIGAALSVAAAGEKSEFELTVGKTVYSINLDEAFEIVAVDGSKLPAVLRKRAGIWRGHGLTFEHPAGIRVRAETPQGRVVIMVETAPGNFSQLQLYLVEVDPARVQRLTLGSVKATSRRRAPSFRRRTTLSRMNARSAGRFARARS